MSPKLTIILSIALKEIVTNEVGYFWYNLDIVAKTNNSFKKQVFIECLLCTGHSNGQDRSKCLLMDFILFFLREREREREDRGRGRCRESILSKLPTQHGVREDTLRMWYLAII